MKHKKERQEKEEESEHGGHRKGRLSMAARVTMISEKGIEGLFGEEDSDSSDDESSASDDDIDFSLCTLLDMKSNSEQLQEVLDKLNLEAETFEGY